MRRFGVAGFMRGLVVGMLARFVITAVILILPTAVFANSSIARFGGGGIELIKSDDIRMLEEILQISTQKVKVTYRFLNESDKDIEATVAFPLPKYDPFSSFFYPGAQGIMATFEIRVNGRPAEKQNLRKATVNDRDVTDHLRKSGLSDEEIFSGVMPSRDNFQKFLDLKRKIGDWRIEETATWQQVFPSHREVVIEHEYVPSAGSGYALFYKLDSEGGFKTRLGNLWNSFSGKDNKDEDCLDEMTKGAIAEEIKKAVSKGANSGTVSHRDVEYVLGTGRNWKGPIGLFRLRLIKEKPEQFVSLCFPGKPKKISPTVYEFVQKDYVPQDKLIVYFYTVKPHSVIPSNIRLKGHDRPSHDGS